MANSAPPPREMLPCAAVQPISGGSAPGTAPTSVAERGPPLHRRVDRQVDDERRQREPAASQFARTASSTRPATRQRDAEDARVARRHAAVRQRAQARPPHQRVGVALVHLVEHRGAAGHERGSADRLRHRDQVGPAGPAKVVPAALVATTRRFRRGLVSAT